MTIYTFTFKDVLCRACLLYSKLIETSFKVPMNLLSAENTYIWTCNSIIATPMTKNLLQTQRQTYQMHRYSLLTIHQWQTMQMYVVVVAGQQHSFLMSHRQELLVTKLKLQRKIHNVKVLVMKLKLQRKMRKFDTSTYIAYTLISASSMHVQP